MSEKINDEKRLHALRDQLTTHSYHYYVLDDPLLSDAEYDELFDELVALEAKYPEWMTADSPTQRVGGAVLDKFEKVTHPAPMLSLGKASTPEALHAWHTRVSKLVTELVEEDVQFDFIVEPKIDGLTVVLHYRDGLFVQGATRGDGEIGEDVTGNLATIAAVPKRIPLDSASEQRVPEYLVVRGEVFFPLDKWATFNADLAAADKRTYMNPRNAASGALRQLDPAVTAARPLTLFIYDFVVAEGIDIPKQTDRLSYLREIGFPVPAPEDVTQCDTIDQVADSYQAWLKKRAQLNYEVDGLVVKINDRPLAESLGYTGKNPRGAIAMKFPAQEKTTKLVAVDVNVGRTGILAPLARLEPVEIAGVVVRNATLHNFEMIAHKDIRIGDTVTVKRAGDVIPYIMGPVTAARDGTETVIVPPTDCPECGEPAHQPEEEVAIYCDNPACPAQLVRRVEYFVSRTAMDIDKFGTKTGALLVEQGLVHDIADIYTLDQKRDQLLELEGFKEKKVDNLLSGVEASKENTAERVLTAIGIRYVGSSVAKLLLAHFGSIRDTVQADNEQIEVIDGVGSQTAKSISAWMTHQRNRDLLDKLEAAGLIFTSAREPVTADQPLFGLTFVVTGTLPTHSRDQAKALIEQHGGKVTSSVSKKTSYLLAGEKAGSKLAKAEKAGVSVIDEAQFLQMIAG